MVERVKRIGDLQPLLYWIRERENIRIRKEVNKELPPWTQDPILNAYRFTNVRRRDDRVSRWLQKNVLTKKNLELAGEDSFILFTALCRWINWPPTIDRIMKAGLWVKMSDWQDIAEVIKMCAAEGKAFTGAYMVTNAGWKDKPKSDFVTGPVLESLVEVIDELKARLEKRSKKAVWELMVRQKYWKAFMAGQVVDDWSWTALLTHPKDAFTWAPQGPGSVRGYNRLMGYALEETHEQEFWCQELVRIREAVIAALGSEFNDVDLMSIQNTLCECDKYLRVKNGEGKPRSLYKPETAY